MCGRDSSISRKVDPAANPEVENITQFLTVKCKRQSMGSPRRGFSSLTRGRCAERSPACPSSEWAYGDAVAFSHTWEEVSLITEPCILGPDLTVEPPGHRQQCPPPYFLLWEKNEPMLVEASVGQVCQCLKPNSLLSDMITLNNLSHLTSLNFSYSVAHNPSLHPTANTSSNRKACIMFTFNNKGLHLLGIPWEFF